MGNMVFFDVLRRANAKADVTVAKAFKNKNSALRFTFSKEAVNRLHANKIILALDSDHRNRIYFYDAEQLESVTGFTLCKITDSPNAGRYISVDCRSFPNINTNYLVGEYTLERDHKNKLFIALKQPI